MLMHYIAEAIRRIFYAVVAAAGRISAYVLRVLEFSLTYLVPSFIVSYITLYFPRERSWKLLCMVAYMVSLVIHLLTSRHFFRKLGNNLRGYLIITYVAYSFMILFSFSMYYTFEDNVLLFNFANATMRAFELLRTRTIVSMVLTHGIALIVLTFVPLYIIYEDRAKAKLDAAAEELQKEFDDMGMVFNPDETIDEHTEPDMVKDDEQYVGLLFDPHETEEESAKPDILQDDEQYVGLLFDPDETIEEHTEVAIVQDDEQYVELLFDPDEPAEVSDEGDNEQSEYEEYEEEDEEQYVGLLFDPDELPEPIPLDGLEENDEEEFVGLLFDPDELPDLDNDEDEDF